MQAILFVSQPDESAVLTVVLQQAGFRVRAVRDLERAIESWPEQPAELILIVLPEANQKALKQISQMRAFTAAPIIVISDPLPEDVQVSILEEGANLLIQKPYGVRMLLAQIRAVLRQSTGVPFFSLPVMTHAEVVLDPSRRTVTVAEGTPKHLTQLEFRLLYTLMTHIGQVIPPENLVEHVWGYSGDGNRELVRGLVQRLRSKVEPTPREPRYILTEPGVGYYFTN